jgi:hypothetical protein
MAYEPLFMKDVDLILGTEAEGTNFKCQMRSVVLTPEVNVVRIKTLCPTGQYSNVDDPEWTLDLGYLFGRDVTEAEAALAEYLRAHTGEKVDFFFAPWAGEEGGYSGIVTLLPGPIGGEQGSYSEQSVQLPVDGQPEPWAGTGS